MDLWEVHMESGSLRKTEDSWTEPAGMGEAGAHESSCEKPLDKKPTWPVLFLCVCVCVCVCARARAHMCACVCMGQTYSASYWVGSCWPAGGEESYVTAG